MPISAEDLYRAAQSLDRMKPPLVSEEICARTMLNRMYYAAYLATREAVRAQFNDPRFDVTHGALADALMRAPDPDVNAVGTRLRKLRRDGGRSVYNPQLVIPRTLASIRLGDARCVLDNVGRLAGRFPPMRRR